MRTFQHNELSLSRILAAKQSHSISVCIPARNEAATVGSIVSKALAFMRSDRKLIDEIVVIDDGSTDGTADIAARSGALVVSSWPNADPTSAPHGKGHAMQRGLAETQGDIVLFLDADVIDFEKEYISAMVGPLLIESSLMLVKGAYKRPSAANGTGGGRVTELAARPLLSLLFPHLSSINQPLAGETAGRRSALEQLQFCHDYGVEVAILIDIAKLYGVQSIAQSDLGSRTHRNRSLSELGEQATAVAHAVLQRAGVQLPVTPVR